MEFGSYDDDSVTTAGGLNDTGHDNDELTPTAAGPLSPPSGAESLFLAGLATERLTLSSAASISEQIRINHRKSSSSSLVHSLGGGSNSRRSRAASSDRSLLSYASARSTDTDDFASCVGSESDLLSSISTSFINMQRNKNLNNMLIEIPFRNNSNSSRSPARSMIFKIAEDSQLDTPTNSNKDEEEHDDDNNNMSTTYSNSKYATTSSKTAPPKSSSGPDLSKVDPAEIVYTKAKDVWSWGKTVPVFGFFVRTTEAVTGKALGVVGTDFGALDSRVSTKLADLDASILNPAIVAIAKIVVDVAGKSEDTLKPIIDILMSKLGLIKSEADESTPDAHKPPEVTPVKK